MSHCMYKDLKAVAGGSVQGKDIPEKTGWRAEGMQEKDGAQIATGYWKMSNTGTIVNSPKRVKRWVDGKVNRGTR